MQRYAVLEKKVGETPLQTLEGFRVSSGLGANTPLTYAGRLDPMASGLLLILIGEECKNKEAYLKLDKEYEFQVLLGVGSDTGDVLGMLNYEPTVPDISDMALRGIAKQFSNTDLALPYPAFSSKTVQGKPLHTWAAEGRLDEIEIPTASTHIHTLTLARTETMPKAAVYTNATQKIETIPPVTQLRKSLGNDFRRDDIRLAWKEFNDAASSDTYKLATFRCVASSGTYMRSLSEVIAKQCGTHGLAYSIHRTKIGRYQQMPFGYGFWRSQYTV